MMREVRLASGLFLALLAILAQLTVAAAVPASTVSLADVTMLCQHDGDAGAPAHRPPGHSLPDCLLCFSCHNAAAPAALVAVPPLLPIPATRPAGRTVVLPPATAPPPRGTLAARPRGPPILV
jgi:hypothetical protein